MWRLKKYCRDRETGRSHTILFAFTSPIFVIIFFIAYFTSGSFNLNLNWDFCMRCFSLRLLEIEDEKLKNRKDQLRFQEQSLKELENRYQEKLEAEIVK